MTAPPVKVIVSNRFSILLDEYSTSKPSPSSPLSTSPIPPSQSQKTDLSSENPFPIPPSQSQETDLSPENPSSRLPEVDTSDGEMDVSHQEFPSSPLPDPPPAKSPPPPIPPKPSFQTESSSSSSSSSTSKSSAKAIGVKTPTALPNPANKNLKGK